MSKSFIPKTSKYAGRAILSVIAITLLAWASMWTSARHAKPSSVGQSMQAAGAQQPSRVHATLAALPLAFEANQGQTDSKVKYMARGNGYTLFLTSNDAVMAVHSFSPATADTTGQKADRLGRRVPSPRSERQNEPRNVKEAAIHMRMVGANSHPAISAGSQLPGVINYYIGNNPSKWHEGVKQYSAVNYRDVYPGIDMSYHGQQRQLEFDFIVAPGANPAPIELGFRGASKIATDPTGNLVLSSDAGYVTLHKPVAYQEKNGRREFVDVAFRSDAANEVGFALGAYDHGRELVIDPALSLASYLGGNNDDEANAIAVDGSGNIFVTGETKSTTFGGKPAGPNFDVFVSEFNGTASSLVYTSIFSGTGDCSGNAIAVDGTGGAYVAGAATSGFPTSAGAFQTVFGGGTIDGFAMKLTAATGVMTYSTYLGGNGIDEVQGIAIDSASPPNAYVAGETYSSNFPGTSSSTIQSSLAGSNDNGFVTKINATGTALTYSTYLGGTSYNLATAISLDGSNDAYVTGITASSNFPTTAGAFQTTFGGTQNAFVAEIKADGSKLVYSSYLGGSGADTGLGITVDAAGEAYVTGSTTSSNFPTLNAAQNTLGGNSATNVFVTKLNAAGSGLLFSTYYGGSLDDVGTAIALDSFGDAYITGRTTSSTYPVSNAFQTTLNGASDAIVTEFSNTGFVVYSSFFGGPGAENSVNGNGGAIGGIVVDSSSNAYLTGDTSSNSGIALSGAYQTTYGGNPVDAFVAKVGPAPADFSVATSPTSTSVTSGQTTSQITVTVSSVNASFGQAVTLSCGSVPTYSKCSFGSSSLTPTTSAQTTTLTISTNGSASADALPGSHGSGQFLAAIFVPLIGVTLLSAGLNSRRRDFSLFALALALMAMFLMPACGGSGYGGGGGGGGGTNTSPGTYNLTISGAAGGATHSAPFTLTVH